MTPAPLEHPGRLQPRSFRSVLVVDDPSASQDAVVAILSSAFAGAEIRNATNLEVALELLQAASIEDLVLLEPALRGRFGMEALTRVRALFPQAPVVVRSSIDNRTAICAAFDAGILGYFPKTMAPPLVIAGLQLIATGGIFVPSEVLDRALDVHPSILAGRALTVSQTRVLNLLLTGRSNRDIGKELNITEGTVKQHVHAVYRALGVTSRAAVIANAVRHNLRFPSS